MKKFLFVYEFLHYNYVLDITESMHLSCLAGSMQQKIVVLDTSLQKNVSINDPSVFHRSILLHSVLTDNEV